MGRPRHSSRQIDRLLAAFMRDPGMWRYGYELAKDSGIPTGTLYPALLRLADDDYLEAKTRLSATRKNASFFAAFPCADRTTSASTPVGSDKPKSARKEISVGSAVVVAFVFTQPY